MEVKGAFALGGEVRRLQIIYFLSRRMGRVDHPHLIRVHHLTRNGVYLRDVKRWLADLRGKDMPQAFAWSYKRRYKTGYVWQDLLDDDLITPISDNEYVLKGSEIIYSPFDSPPKSDAEKRSCLFKEQPVKDEVQPPLSKQEAFHLHKYSNNNIDIQTKVCSEISDESPHVGSERSTLTDDFDAMKPQGDENHSADALNPNTNYQQNNKSENSSFYSNFLLKNNNNNNKYKDKDGKEMAPSSFSSSSSSSHSSSHQSPAAANGTSSSKSNSKGMFRNLISCGAVDTNDSVLVMLNRANKTTTSNKSTRRSSQDIIKADRICKADHKRGASAGVFGTCWNPQEQPQQPQKHTSTASSYDGEKGSNKQQKEPEFSSQKVASAAYRPVGGPHCSQCRKQFKPEKLHSHMKSCRGKKALNKTAAASVEKTPEMGSRTSTCDKSAAAYYLDQLNMHSTD